MPVVEVPLLPRLPRAGIGSNLRDRIPFPTFEGCPTAGQPDGKYLGSDGTPLRPWCFVGEITEVDAMTHKLHLVATDMEGRRDVHIYCNGEDLEKRLHYQGAQPHIGYTVAVLYASKRELIEGGVGLIVEDVLFMKVH
ncbi:uncharacterized protein PHACADRAFT_253059 [Phanerochaete carnosa HHB-10118-sp]|uniref:Uncharacterized protein n=1 Tax=Phanerochaete carnosa (strain HHB-10118-sp) TaxID=650164 RepID=K5X6T9_PHACS|nr:uncharacterized protein PHACADRAFT_253059 [Phanerochaete carnosa HHB-10118-sp]EKM58602.1 hypothetical protein PHACADRAFT_253059 [Phanerochaete carnosa HHB-10118-sp]